MSTMRAARLYGPRDIRVQTVPVPEIGPGELLLRVKAATVCGTDLRMFGFGANGVDENHPLTLCHEFAGVIEKTGPGVDGFEPGERVSVAPNIGCGRCFSCVSGQSHHCETLSALGVHMDGGFAEYVKIPARAVVLGNVVPLPETVSFAAAAANEALSCVYSSFERYAVRPGDTVAVIGAGAIGLMHAKLCRMAGAAKIILNDLSEERLKTCAWIEPNIIAVKDGLPEVLREITHGRGADVVITACGAAAAQKAAFDLAARDGRVNFFGGLPAGRECVELNTNQIHYKQLTVLGTTRSSPFHYRQTLNLIADGLIDVDALITHRFALEDIRAAFENAEKAVGLKQCVAFP